MSEYLTHVAIADDCMRLASHQGAVCGAFQKVISSYAEVVRMGSISRWGDPYTVSGFKQLRQRWPSRSDGDSTEEELAYFIGWRTHNAADRYWKPKHRELQPEYYAAQGRGEPVPPPSDARIYNDLIVFHEVYRGGEVAPTTPGLYDLYLGSHPAGGSVCVDQTDSLMLGVFQRTLLELQAWVGNGEDFDAWYEKFSERFQDYRIPLERYAEVYRTPNNEYMRRFVIENNFYDRADPLIQFARAIQDRQPPPKVSFDQAVATAETQSEYAQVLRKGFLYVKAASDFFEMKIDDHEFADRLDLAKAHV